MISKKRDMAVRWAATLLVLIFAAAVLLPIWWIFRSSLMSTGTINQYPPELIPHEWLWSNYSKALETFDYWLYFKNTFTIIIPAVTFGTITAIFCGYAFARLRFRGKNVFFKVCVGTILLPGMVTLIPLYIFWTKGLGLGDTYWPLILPFLTGGGFFNIFLIRQFLMTIPMELDEAASIDGAGRMRILWTILVPAIKPAVVVVAMMLFIQIWNDLLQQIIYINSMSKFTFAIALTNFTGSFGTNWPVALAATFMTILPGIVIYILGQKSFVEGIVLTGMKN
ncbi:carbohydrate ABC transporter permease [Jingyaoa shaoxingensis]|uniref:Carbohydrate ABC transporter permease n=1 Tax=Jingyaoa shaoxingensis TaxID=2763671 RepID=A0ABR7N6Z5_9FIRM|nr:carbohydrate ABC transporter permease [Jingyaoa shaoxingensis]MBC8572151.1 carbohydrate ABC transporter permease [Jingyaoa shaoxingensis]